LGTLNKFFIKSVGCFLADLELKNWAYVVGKVVARMLMLTWCWSFWVSWAILSLQASSSRALWFSLSRFCLSKVAIRYERAEFSFTSLSAFWRGFINFLYIL
jgi:hypothetical protein